MTAAQDRVYGLVDGSPQEFCNDEQPHDPHEFLVGMRRFQCPGLPFGGPEASSAAQDRALAERRLWGRNVLVRELGRCCGRSFYTWEGWWAHRRSHQRVIVP